MRYVNLKFTCCPFDDIHSTSASTLWSQSYVFMYLSIYRIACGSQSSALLTYFFIDSFKS